MTSQAATNELCPMPTPDQAPSRDGMQALFSTVKRIVVVGASPKPDRVSYQVIQWMQEHSTYEFAFVNPTVTPTDGEGSAALIPGTSELALNGASFYSELSLVPGTIDMVNIFLREDRIPAVVAEAIALQPQVIWLQLGLTSPEACQQAERAGITTVQNRCLKVEYNRTFPVS